MVLVVHDISIGHVLSVDAASSFDHRKLLSGKVFIRIRCETTTDRLLSKASIIITAGGQIRKLLLGFAKLLIVLLLVRVDALDVVSTPHLNFCSVASHIIGVLAVLT